MNYLKIYTKQAAGSEYPNSFANSVHFSLCTADAEEELNQGCGILYARAEIRPDDTLMERGLQRPVIFQKDGEYGILAAYADAEGNLLKPDTLLLWSTSDFINFSEQREVARSDYAAIYESGAVRLEIPDSLCGKIRARWIPLFSVRAEYPQKLAVKSAQELSAVAARVIYSDGSADEKIIIWNE